MLVLLFTRDVTHANLKSGQIGPAVSENGVSLQTAAIRGRYRYTVTFEAKKKGVSWRFQASFHVHIIQGYD
jgi:hypothetical protein